MKSFLLFPLFVLPVFGALAAENSAGSLDRPAPIVPLSPDQAIAAMELPEGYALELVVGEPHVEEPVLAVFDGNGRMYVAEMRTYMQDIDGTGKFERVSRVSRHEDTDGDGTFDRHTVFVDNLLLPRMVLPLDDRVIIGETNSNDLYVYRDVDGDGVADEKNLWFEGGPRGGNLEHQPSGLLWALDNGIYTTFNPYRFRFTDGVVARDETIENGGQWGLTQDDFGKVWFVHAGQETGPVHFQQHVIYGQFSIEGEQSEDYKVVWPIDNIPDTQGGRFQLRDDNTLNHFTATCGQDIFRGDRLPAEMRGDLFFAEPVGRLIRRTKITVDDGVTRLRNAYDRVEFLRSADPLFRPVNMVTAPDGTLYIVDMYRGIIQEGNWTREGTYLREQILRYELEKQIGRGRIYRLVHRDFKPGPQPRMLDETPAQWVGHLSHPNGWWRDTAQKLIIVKGDKSVVPALRDLFEASGDARARVHALWTLEGLGMMDESLVRAAIGDRDNEIVKAGIRLSEPIVKNGENRELTESISALLGDDDPNVVIQAMLSLKRAGVPDAKSLAKSTAESSNSQGVYAINEQLWRDEAEDPFLMSLLGPSGLKSFRSGRSFYNSLCYSCHGSDGQGVPIGDDRTLAPPLGGSPRVLGSSAASINIVLHGLQGPLDGTDYGAPMIPMASYTDEQLADVLTYVRNSFGNRSAAVLPADIADAREASGGRVDFWTIAELEGELPYLQVPLTRFVNRGSWKLSASHRSENAHLAVEDGSERGYVAPNTPYPNMWFQVELPAPATIRSILMDSRGTKGAFPLSYEVSISDDGEAWSEPVAAGNGEVTTQIHLEQPVTSKFVRITLTRKEGWQPWAIRNFELYGLE